MADGEEGNSGEVRVLGVRLTLKTDIVAALGFFLALVSVIWQLIAFLSAGPSTTLMAPDQVYMFRVQATDGKDRLHLVMNFAYANSGPEGHDEIIVRESVRLRVAGKAHDYGWDGFGKIKGDLASKGLHFEEDARSQPFAVPGRGAITHQTRIVPWPKDCSEARPGSCDPLENHVLWDEFISHLRAALLRKESSYTFRLVAHALDRKMIESRCKIEISSAIVDVMEQYGAYNPTCHPVPSGHDAAENAY